MMYDKNLVLTGSGDMKMLNIIYKYFPIVHAVNDIKKNDLQGSLEDGDTCKYGGKTYKGGQVIFCETDEMYDLCGKDKIAMTELTVIANKYMEN